MAVLKIDFESEWHLILILVIIALIFLVCAIVWLAEFANQFRRELRLINNEIGRTEGAEQRHWIRRRKRLWLSLIPFVKY